jgi:hypothetical protein
MPKIGVGIEFEMALLNECFWNQVQITKPKPSIQIHNHINNNNNS